VTDRARAAMSAKDEPPAPWSVLESTELADCRIFRLLCRRMRREDPPADSDFFLLDTPDWVNVVALTDDDDLVLVTQFRHGVERITLEIAGGMVDPGETPREAAERELREETGYVARDWKQIGVIDPNPAIQNNRTWTFLATGAAKREEPSFDATEQCRVVLAPWSDTPRLVAEGRITHALVVVGLHFEMLRRMGESSGETVKQ
jgi:8-oxo-dGTP pyrophosphatase MutT (NUDIX family)